MIVLKILLTILLTVLKIIGIVLLVLLGLIFLISFIRVGVTAEYSAEGPEVTAHAGPVNLKLFPRPKKEEQSAGGGNKKQKKKKKKDKKPKEDQETAQKPKESPIKKVGGLIPMFRELLGLAIELQASFRNKLRIKELVLLLSVGGFGSDPSKAAQLYGKAWAAIGNLMPLLMETFRIEKRKVGAEIDFTEPDNRIYVRATLIISIGAVLRMGLWYGLRALKILWRHILKKRVLAHFHKKGGKKHGTSSQ